MILNEERRPQLLSRSRVSKKEKEDNRTRYEKRVKSKISSNVRNYNSINMNSLFKEGILTVDIEVQGETNKYIVTVSFGGFLDQLKDQLERSKKEEVTLRDIIRALINSFNDDDVYVRCNCLHPDTEILLLDGTKARIEDLCNRFNSGEQLYVYSTDDAGDFKPGVVRDVWKSGSSSELVKVTLDSGDIIQTTPDHRFMMRDGSYIAAKYLKEHQSLMPMYFSDCNGYQTVKFNSTGRYHSVYKQVAYELLPDKITAAEIREASTNKHGPYKVAIHHKDFNKRNNTPTNLEPLTQKHKDKLRASRKNETPEHLAIRMRKCNETKILTILNYLIDNNLELTLDNYNRIQKSNFKSYPSIDKRFDSIDDAVSYFQLNHKVAKVEFIHLNDPVDVYDIDVDTWHNFTTAAGVVLHNCADYKYRLAYWNTKDKINIGAPENIPSDTTNPNNDLGPGCKHIMLVLSNHNWILKVASTINNYIHYMEKHYERLYDDVIYPAIYGHRREEITIDDTELITDKPTLDIANIEGSTRGRFSKTYQPSRNPSVRKIRGEDEGVNEK